MKRYIAINKFVSVFITLCMLISSLPNQISFASITYQGFGSTTVNWNMDQYGSWNDFNKAQSNKMGKVLKSQTVGSINMNACADVVATEDAFGQVSNALGIWWEPAEKTNTESGQDSFVHQLNYDLRNPSTLSFDFKLDDLTRKFRIHYKITTQDPSKRSGAQSAIDLVSKYEGAASPIRIIDQNTDLVPEANKWYHVTLQFDINEGEWNSTDGIVDRGSFVCTAYINGVKYLEDYNYTSFIPMYAAGNVDFPNNPALRLEYNASSAQGKTTKDSLYVSNLSFGLSSAASLNNVSVTPIEGADDYKNYIELAFGADVDPETLETNQIKLYKNDVEDENANAILFGNRLRVFAADEKLSANQTYRVELPDTIKSISGESLAADKKTYTVKTGGYDVPELLLQFAQYQVGAVNTRAAEKIYPVASQSFYYDAPSVKITPLHKPGASGDGNGKSVYYVINAPIERIGTDSDYTIVDNLLDRGFNVFITDYMNSPQAVSPCMEWQLQKVKYEMMNQGSYLNGLSCDSKIIYALPAGYNITVDETYWSIDKHATDGILERIVDIWNTDFKGHFGSTAVSYPDGTSKLIQNIDAKSIFDCVQEDGSLIDMDAKMDIIYPTNPTNRVPIIVQASSRPDRGNTWGQRNLSGDCLLTGFLFNGYAGAVYDYVFTPMAREDEYGYFDGNTSSGCVTGDNYTYSVAFYNMAKCDTAALRKVRYLADTQGEKYHIDKDKVGVSGISKSGVVTRLGNPHPELLPEQRYLPGHHGETRYEAGKTQDETKTVNGAELTVCGGEPQPWLTYSDGTPIPSNAQFVIAESGGCTEYITKDGAPMYIAGTMDMTNTASQGCYYTFYPMFASKCFQNDIPLMHYVCRYVAHEYARGLDEFYGKDTYSEMHTFANYFLKDAPVSVAYTSPANGETNVKTTNPILVKFEGQVSETEIQKVTITNYTTGKTVNGVWTACYGNTEWSFAPTDMQGGYKYTLHVPETLSGENGKPIKSGKNVVFYTEPEQAKSAELIADDGNMTLLKTQSTNQGVYLQFAQTAADFESSSTVSLRFSVTNDAANIVEIYSLKNVTGDSLQTAQTGDLLGKINICGKGEYQADVTSYVKKLSNGEKAAFVLKAKKEKEIGKLIRSFDFEADAEGARSGKDYTYNYAPIGSVTTGKNTTPGGNKSAMMTYFSDNTNLEQSPNRLPWLNGIQDILHLSNVTKNTNLTADDYGRKFHISAKLYDTAPNGRLVTAVLGNAVSDYSYGDGIDTKNKGDITFRTSCGKWETMAFDFCINNPLYWKTLLKTKLRLSAESFGTQDANNPDYELYIDDITVTEDVTEVCISGDNTQSAIAPSLVLHRAQKVNVSANRETYVSSGTEAGKSFAEDDKLRVSGRSISMLARKNKKVYARISLAESTDATIDFVKLSVDKMQKGTVNVYGLNAQNDTGWTVDTINYLNAPANDVFTDSVDLTKVYGNAPLSSLNVSGKGEYMVNISQYTDAMRKAGAQYGTLIFTLASEPRAVLYTKNFDDIDRSSIFSFKNGGAEGNCFKFDEEDHTNGKGYSFRITTDGHDYNRVKTDILNLTAQTNPTKLTVNDLGKKYRVTYWIKSDKAGEFVSVLMPYDGNVWVQKKTNSYPTANVWKKYTYDFELTQEIIDTINGPTTGIPAGFTIESGKLGTIYANIWIDDISLTDLSNGEVDFTIPTESAKINNVYRKNIIFENYTNSTWKTAANVPEENTTAQCNYGGYNFDQVGDKVGLVTNTPDHTTGNGTSLMLFTHKNYCRYRFMNFWGKTWETDDIGKTYQVSFWAKTDTEGGYFDVGFTSTGSGTAYLVNMYKSSEMKFDQANHWQNFTYTFTVDETMLESSYTDGAVRNYLQNPSFFTIKSTGLAFDSGCTMWVDDIVIMSTDSDTGTNCVLAVPATAVATVTNGVPDGVTGVDRPNEAELDYQGIQKAYLSYDLSELDHIQKVLLNLPVTKSNGQIIKIYGITNLAEIDEAMTYITAPANNENESMMKGRVYGASPLAEMAVTNGNMLFDVTEYAKSNGGKCIFAVTSEDQSTKECSNFTFDNIKLTTPLDYVSDGTVTFANGEAAVSGKQLILHHTFGGKDTSVQSGKIYSISADITATADTQITIGVSDKNGVNESTSQPYFLNAGAKKTLRFEYCATEADVQNKVCALVIKSTTSGFAADNIKILKDESVYISKNASLTVEIADQKIIPLEFADVSYAKKSNIYTFDIDFTKNLSDEKIIVGVYDGNGKMTDVKLLDANGTSSYMVSLSAEDAPQTVKAYVIKTLTSLLPVCKSYCASIE